MSQYTSARLRKQTKAKIKAYAKKHKIRSITQPWKLASDDEILNIWHSKIINIDSDSNN